MRKDNVWKQVVALVLSAALVVGNGSPVSAAAGDRAADNGAAGSTLAVTSPTDGLTFGADGTMSSDKKTYEEGGIEFKNDGVEIVDAPIITGTDGQPATGETVTGDDGGHGKVFRFSNEDNDNTKTGETWITTVADSLQKYDFSQGFTFSCDIYPEEQCNDWNYVFAIGMLGEVKNAFIGTMGFSVGYDSELRKQTEGASWVAITPAGNWIEENKGSYEWDYFKKAENAHRWYNIKYVYRTNGITVLVDDVPILFYADVTGYVEGVLKELSKGQLRLGKGVVTGNEGYVGLMDNIEVKPVKGSSDESHKHVYEGDGEVVQEATCTENGYKRFPACKVCGLASMEILPAKGHKFDGELVAQKDATCAEKGMKAHYKCSQCSIGYAIVTGDDGQQKEEVEKKDLEIEKVPHTYTKKTTKATPDKDGEIYNECSVCPGNTKGHKETLETIYKVNNITLAGTSFAHTGKEIKPAVTVKDSKGTVIAASNYTVSYSNNKNPGTAKVTVTFKGDKYDGSVDKTFTIGAAASLTLNKTKATLYTGKASKTITIKPTVTGASQTVTWVSSNPKVATVKNGKITAVKAGKATITATANGISQKVTVTVKNPTITVKKGKKTVKTVAVKRKKSVKLTVTVSPKNSGIKVAKLTKKQAKIATVTYKKGKLTIKGKKKGTVKVKITSGKGTKTITVKVK